MTIKYPNGKAYHETAAHEVKKRGSHLVQNAGNRGMDFEADINLSNEYYAEKDICIITKRPTPINVVKVDYSHGAIITQAYFEKQSTTDYNGVYKGHYIDFEAKSARGRTSFPLSNIAPQQIKHLRAVKRHGGIAFFLINFAVLGETYLVDADFICDFYEKRPRASIPVADIRKAGHLVKEGYNPRYDYIPLVEEFLLK
jgi:recombination protein U